jgi:hypothetical protein
MKSITIHGLDEDTARRIETQAKADGQSLNRTIKNLLGQSLGIKPAARNRHAENFSEFLGVWGKKDQEEFEKAARTFRTIDDEDWR